MNKKTFLHPFGFHFLNPQCMRLTKSLCHASLDFADCVCVFVCMFIGDCLENIYVCGLLLSLVIYFVWLSVHQDNDLSTEEHLGNALTRREVKKLYQ